MPITQRLDVGNVLSVRNAEGLLAALVQEHGRAVVHLDMSRCQHVKVGAAWRLGNALRLVHHELEVSVPDPDEFRSSQWFLNFTRTGLGPAIARRAARIFSDNRDITLDVREYYSPTRSVEAANAILVTNVSGNPMVDVDSFDAFNDRFRLWLDRAIRRRDFLSQAHRGHLAELVFQSLQNIVDHSAMHPYVGEPPLSLFALAIYRKADASLGFIGGFDSYLARTRERLAAVGSAGFAELLIDDDGIGIPARQSQDSRIYEGPIEVEAKALEHALVAGGTIKFRRQDSCVRGDPGFGFTKIEESICELGAYAELRTGRQLISLDPTADAACWRRHDGGALAPMPGTALHIVIPLISQQTSMFGAL